MFQEAVGNGEAILYYCRSTLIIADTLRNPLEVQKFKTLKDLILMIVSCNEIMQQRMNISSRGGVESRLNAIRAL